MIGQSYKRLRTAMKAISIVSLIPFSQPQFSGVDDGFVNRVLSLLRSLVCIENSFFAEASIPHGSVVVIGGGRGGVEEGLHQAQGGLPGSAANQQQVDEPVGAAAAAQGALLQVGNIGQFILGLLLTLNEFIHENTLTSVWLICEKSMLKQYTFCSMKVYLNPRHPQPKTRQS